MWPVLSSSYLCLQRAAWPHHCWQANRLPVRCSTLGRRMASAAMSNPASWWLHTKGRREMWRGWDWEDVRLKNCLQRLWYNTHLHIDLKSSSGWRIGWGALSESDVSFIRQPEQLLLNAAFILCWCISIKMTFNKKPDTKSEVNLTKRTIKTLKDLSLCCFSVFTQTSHCLLWTWQLLQHLFRSLYTISQKAGDRLFSEEIALWLAYPSPLLLSSVVLLCAPGIRLLRC